MFYFFDFTLFLKNILFIFRESGKEGEREGEKHQHVVASCVPPTEDLSHNPDMCPRLGIEPVTVWFASGAQSTEPHQPGQLSF